MTSLQKKQRDDNIEAFKEEFNLSYGYVPTMRRMKSGSLLFDEGGNHEMGIDNFLLAHQISDMKYVRKLKEKTT
jgi:hypothetical protein